ncbi:Alkaline phosphatase synthesis transcriptional regulatory protein SphR [Phycisphaerales bacterium]|nr:Alkaline phosphatase synthesis transcriptional regulatory protein SphR [Phycisphaerales bacterium]
MPRPVAILVCDDEAHIRHIVAHKLVSAGFVVREGRNGQEGLDAIADGFCPDLVITDFQMPVLSGLEMCQRLRRLPQTATTPVLMLTARGYILPDLELSQTNIRNVINKPFGVRQLLERVQEALAESRASRNAA